MSDLAERYNTCGRCVHGGESDDADISKSVCYLCRRNPEDHRIDRFEENKEITTCEHCKGTGWEPPGRNKFVTIERCTVCHGVGMIY